MKVRVENQTTASTKNQNTNEVSSKIANSARGMVINTSINVVRMVGVSFYLILSGLVCVMAYNVLLPHAHILSFLDNPYLTITPQIQQGVVALFSASLFIVHLGGNTHNITNKDNLTEIGASTTMFGLLMLIASAVAMFTSFPLQPTLMVAGGLWLLMDTITDFSK